MHLPISINKFDGLILMCQFNYEMALCNTHKATAVLLISEELFSSQLLRSAKSARDNDSYAPVLMILNIIVQCFVS